MQSLFYQFMVIGVDIGAYGMKTDPVLLDNSAVQFGSGDYRCMTPRLQSYSQRKIGVKITKRTESSDKDWFSHHFNIDIWFLIPKAQ